jgi:asparagine synthase (glutamine-hydrolysing)
MCGITVVLRAGADACRNEVVNNLTAMQGLQRHRGPDGAGTVIEELGDGRVLGLGHQRLAVLDLSNSATQPMMSPCGRYTLVFNGEIYNYRELARELSPDPILTTSTGDTAVLLTALIRWGDKALEKLRGMWAFAWFDKTTKQLLISRDRLGIKPLYYRADAQGIAFASEVKALLPLQRQRHHLNRSAIHSYLVRSVTDHDHGTFFEEISAVPAGTVTVLAAGGPIKCPEFRPFWRHPFEITAHPSARRIEVADVRSAFEQAMDIHLRSDAPLGVMLSGGFDSSAIVGVARALQPTRQIHAFSVISRDPTLNEERYIRMMSDHAGCSLTTIDVDADPLEMLKNLPEVCWQNDQPVFGFSTVAHWMVMRAVRQHGTKVLLSGQGADEQLAGYARHWYYQILHLVRRGHVFQAAKLYHSFANAGVFPPFQWRNAKRYIPGMRNQSMGRVLGRELQQVSNPPLAGGRSFAELEFYDLTRDSIPMFLHYEDRMSMAFGIELRVPFVDHDLVELFGRIPVADKLRDGWTKAILRDAMEPYLPKEICRRRDKKGFSMPQEPWLRSVMAESVRKRFAGGMIAEEMGLLKPGAALMLHEEMVKAKGLASHKDVFRLLALECWLERVSEYVR